MDIGDAEEITNDVSDERVVEKKLKHKRFFRVGAYVKLESEDGKVIILVKYYPSIRTVYFIQLSLKMEKNMKTFLVEEFEKIKKQRMRTNEKFSADKLKVLAKRKTNSAASKHDKPTGGFSHHEEMARQAKKDGMVK